MYLHRAIETTILKAEHQAKAILITGARQVGKASGPRRCDMSGRKPSADQ